MNGHCTCTRIRYHLTDRPLFVHACHCTWCQRESGTVYALNALIETDRIKVMSGSPVAVETPSNSGRGQTILRCPDCQVALWSHYAGGGTTFAFVRVGTLENPATCPPDIHIFTSIRLPWVILPDTVPAVAEYYDRKVQWPDWALARRATALAASKPA